MLPVLLPAVLVLAQLLPQDPPAPAARGPVVGKAAPTARVNDHDGRATEIGKAADGKWTILAFYPKAATPG